LLKRVAVLGCLGTLVPVVAVVAGLLVAGDIGARRYATGQLSDRVSAGVPDASGVHARIHSFPFVGRVLLGRSIDDVGVHIDRLTGRRGVVFSDLDVDLRGVTVDRHALVNQRKVKLARIKRGTVTFALTQQAISDALGRPTEVSSGGVLVTGLGGRQVRGTVTVAPNRGLVLSIVPLPPLGVPLPTLRVLPCLPSVTLAAGRVDFSCTFTTVPAALVQAVSGLQIPAN
jgi:hypothetical protein